MNKAPKILTDSNIKRIHCMGIGGIGVSGLAEILLTKGYQVSGSDIVNSQIIERLKNLGASISFEHNAANIQQADAVVYSSAITKDNLEFQAAETRSIPMIKRGQLLAELLNTQYGIAVCGTHGKTTTSGLMAYTLMHAGLDPTMVMGGVLNHLESPVRIGKSKFFVAEADESDASFLYMQPKVFVLTNIDADHLGTYQNDFNKLKESFVSFLKNMPEDGYVIACIDDPIVKEICKNLPCNFIGYGFSEEADIRAISFEQQELLSLFKVEAFNDQLDLQLNMPGRHNVLNALAVVALASILKINSNKLKEALEEFPGVGRRFHFHTEIKTDNGKALLFDDYGHHPREIAATLQAAHQVWPNRRVVLVFQPHRYTRTRDLMQEFAEVLSEAEELILLDVYSASEAVIPGADGKTLYENVCKCRKIKPTFVPDIKDLTTALNSIIKDNDVVIFQGAGSIGPKAVEIAAELGDGI